MLKLADRRGTEFTTGVILGFTLFGCVSATFPYKYYGMDLTSYEGTLLGPTAQQDVNATACMPTATDKSPCTVMKTSDFMTLKYDYLDIQNRLISCERSKK